MKQQYQEFITRVKERGGKVLTFSCPHCQEGIETPVAPQCDVWDSITTCPFCEAMFVKYVTHNSVTTVAMPQEQ